MSELTEAQKRAVKMLMDAVVDMGTFIDTPDLRKDPAGRLIYRRGAAALRAATEAGFTNQ
jgi:hypothetical protein